ncbi:MAG TPA: 5-formyltetrahydrofolate cyclo-ligase [Candidatus Atopostipes pullistercoris]|uniref:5-formyltetrahydrofolate cyclo-ligase n=1 Tax=Candidatus Atopostipes pullistercoris TaxID=2838467 RepID=A0A9D2JXJ0_9LACT|nr:5-formyltetrahydrofolate cyclo-ligase [Candidatus Atopostipes pullistercoris]
MGEEKKRVREEMIQSLSKWDSSARKEISNQIQDQLFQSDLWRDAQTIGVYLSVGNEWDTREIVNRALEEGRDVVIPKTFPDTKEMVFYQITDLKQTVKGPFNLDEPDTNQTEPVDKDRIDLLVVPGLAFTENGYRIGFGGGYYDRYLANFIHPTVSILHSSQILDTFLVEHFDIPVSYLITEKGIIDC